MESTSRIRRRAIERRELRRELGARRCQLSGAAAPGEVRCVEEFGDGVEAFGMTRDEDQAQARVLRGEAAEDVDGVLFFRLLRAASEEYDVVVSDGGKLAE